MTTPTLSLRNTILARLDQGVVELGYLDTPPSWWIETIRAVVQLHTPHRPDGMRYVCLGCDREPQCIEPEWPCRTIVTIGRRLGVLPE
jgi:hypothetical protein